MEEFDCQKIVFSSSSCVYGDPEYLPVDENHPTGKNCANPYGRSKYITEEIMKDISKANGVSSPFKSPRLASCIASGTTEKQGYVPFSVPR